MNVAYSLRKIVEALDPVETEQELHHHTCRCTDFFMISRNSARKQQHSSVTGVSTSVNKTEIKINLNFAIPNSGISNSNTVVCVCVVCCVVCEK
jgi:hypothetical protein